MDTDDQDSPRRSIPSGITRRQTLAGLGGLGALGIGGLAATSEDELSVDLDAFRWTAQRRRKFAKPFEYRFYSEDEDVELSEFLYGQPEESIDEVSSLHYMGVRWDEYGNPMGNAEASGAWQHTFLLSNFGMAQQMKAKHHTLETGARPVLKNYPITYEAHEHHVSVPKLSVKAVGDDAARDPIAISPLRDKDRFGIIDPGTFEESYQDNRDSIEEFRTFADQIVENRNEYQPNVGALRAAIAREENAEEDAEAVYSMAKAVFALSKRVALPVNALTGLYEIYTGVTDFLEESEHPEEPVHFSQGFEQGYPFEDHEGRAGPHCGMFVTFHVYVAPEESGEVEVRTELDHNDSRSREAYDTFTSTVNWRVGFDALPHPDSADLAPADKFNARILGHSENDPTPKKPTIEAIAEPSEQETRVLREYERSKDPNPNITPAEPMPSFVSDGTDLAFDAFDTTVVDGVVDSYTWSVHYTSEPGEQAEEYVDVVQEESYASSYGSTFEFTVDVPDDADYDDVHMVELEVETYNPEHDERRTGTAQYLFGTTDVGEPEFTVSLDGQPVEGGDLTLSTDVTSTPNHVASIDWEVLEYGYDRPSTVANVTGTGETFTYTPPVAGQYTIEATVTDAVGPVNSRTIDVQVEELDADAEIVGPSIDSIKNDDEKRFHVDYSGIPNVDPSAIVWDFGDGTTKTSEYPRHAFSEEVAGETVTVSVTVPSTTHDVSASATRDYEITLDDNMTVDLEDPGTLVAGETELLEASVSDADSDLSYAFEVENHTFNSDFRRPRREVEFGTPGEYSAFVEVTETDDNRERASDERTLEVKSFAVELAELADVKHGESFEVEAVTAGDDADLTYEWTAYDDTDTELSDVFYGSGTSTQAEFSEPGSKRIEVVATGDEWTDSDSSTLYVEEDEMSVTLEDPGTLVVGETQQIRATVSGAESDLSYWFDVEDHTFNAQPSSETRDVEFDSSGEYTATVIASETGDNGEQATDEITLEVDPKPFEVDIEGPSEVQSNTSATYEVDVANAIGSVTYDWNVSASGDSATVPFEDCGWETVRVTVSEDGALGREGSDEIDVSVTDCDMDVSLEVPSKLEAGDSKSVYADVSGHEADTVHYDFQVEDQSFPSDFESPKRSVTFPVSGEYDAAVTAREAGDNGESASDSDTIEVVSAPEIDVDIDAKTDTSTWITTATAHVSHGDEPIEYTWKLDGDTVDDGRSTNVQPATSGNHTLSVEVTDADGDTASDNTGAYGGRR